MRTRSLAENAVLCQFLAPLKTDLNLFCLLLCLFREYLPSAGGKASFAHTISYEASQGPPNQNAIGPHGPYPADALANPIAPISIGRGGNSRRAQFLQFCLNGVCQRELFRQESRRNIAINPSVLSLGYVYVNGECLTTMLVIEKIWLPLDILPLLIQS